jgi:hypothetical protein
MEAVECNLLSLEEEVMAQGRRLAWDESIASRFAAAIEDVSGLKADVVRLCSERVCSSRPPPEPFPPKSVPVVESTIQASFPSFFEEFKSKRFSLLWRGSRDGFRASEFHRRCDGHSNTFTIILDGEKNIFGGFTPVLWESRTAEPLMKGDPSLRSFVFSLRNPHGVAPLIFPLLKQRSHGAIDCDAKYGPIFQGAFAVWDLCDRQSSACEISGNTYRNDSGLRGDTVLTGNGRFTVTEIEVFEIED